MLTISPRPLNPSPLASSSSSPSFSSSDSDYTISPISTTPSSPTFSTKMSIAMTYRLAHRARAKLGHEASRPSHNLRRLVGHANLLDNLMLELSTADREPALYEPPSPEPTNIAPRHISWAPTERRVTEESDSDSDDWPSSSEDEDEDSDYGESDAESDYDDSDDFAAFRASPHAATYIRRSATSAPVDDLDDEDEEDLSQLRLVRTQSRSAGPSSSPPGLAMDADSSDDELAMPPSPEAPPLDIYRADVASGKEQPLFLEVPPRSPSRHSAAY